MGLHEMLVGLLLESRGSTAQTINESVRKEKDVNTFILYVSGTWASS